VRLIGDEEGKSTGEKPLTIRSASGEVQEASKPTPLKQGKHHVRLANVDDRLTLWVDSELPFGDGVEHQASAFLGPRKNDLEPASIGARGAALSVSGLKLWRDTYYTVNVSSSSDVHIDNWKDPSQWGVLKDPPCKSMYVWPGHYL